MSLNLHLDAHPHSATVQYCQLPFTVNFLNHLQGILNFSLSYLTSSSIANYISCSFKIFPAFYLFSARQPLPLSASCYHLFPDHSNSYLIALLDSSTLPPCSSRCWETPSGFPCQRKRLSLEKRLSNPDVICSTPIPSPLWPHLLPLFTLCLLLQPSCLHCYFLKMLCCAAASGLLYMMLLLPGMCSHILIWYMLSLISHRSVLQHCLVRESFPI